MRFTTKMLAFVVLLAGFSSCVSKKKYEELSASKAATDAQLAQTRTELKDLESEKDALAMEMKSEKERLNGEISGLRSDMDAQAAQMNEINTRLSATEAELEKARMMVSDLFNQYETAGLTVANRDGQLYIATETPFNFGSGSARLSRDERNAIDAMAEKLAGSNIPLTIVGHADSQKGMDNWDLSYRRAKAVASRLIRKGMSPEMLTVAGRGEHDPIGDNSTSEGRSENRRTEIVPNPALGTLMNNN
ncbi:flagellar motor protein MotB [Lewinellaceae bacterium SD302]|nr:flagellar motor protein MotB [Lewinellaceae bacterium SD302]